MHKDDARVEPMGEGTDSPTALDEQSGSAHTSGPWSARESALSRSGNLWFIDRVGGVAIVAETYRESNARLIAAAPDLLAALKEMREAMAAMMRVVSMHPGSIAEDFGAEIARVGVKNGFGVRAQAAIAKAEGR